MKVCVYTLGCKVNTYESEYMMDLLQKAGYRLVEFDTPSDIYIINSCTVTNTADTKTRKVIKECLRKNKDAVIAVVGCFIQNHYEEIKEDANIDIMLGNKDKSKIVSYLEAFLKDGIPIRHFYDMQHQEFEQMEIENFPTKTRAFVKIQDGCNNFCSYCIIPYVRGNLRYKEKEAVLEEITNLVRNGYKEIVLTGIHTGSYGNKEYGFVDLLKEIVRIEGLYRLRISSIEITEINDEMISLLKQEPVIANHLHIPLQSGHNDILKRMNRKYDTVYYERVIEKIRAVRPDIAISTDIIVGFPHETTAMFHETVEFAKRMKFSFIHVFPYSKRDGTVASRMDQQVDGSVKKMRARALVNLAKCLDKEYCLQYLHQEVDVLAESYQDGILLGHTSNYLKVKFPGRRSDLNQVSKVRIEQLEYPYCLGKKLHVKKDKISNKTTDQSMQYSYD